MKSEPSARAATLHRLFESLTEYLTDQCPEEANWEDFDPEIDDLRSRVIEAYEQETGTSP